MRKTNLNNHVRVEWLVVETVRDKQRNVNAISGEEIYEQVQVNTAKQKVKEKSWYYGLILNYYLLLWTNNLFTDSSDFATGAHL